VNNSVAQIPSIAHATWGVVVCFYRILIFGIPPAKGHHHSSVMRTTIQPDNCWKLQQVIEPLLAGGSFIHLFIIPLSKNSCGIRPLRDRLVAVQFKGSIHIRFTEYAL